MSSKAIVTQSIVYPEVAIHFSFDDVKWEGKTIVVMNEVFINEPYKEDNIKSKGRQAGVEHIKKIVSRV